MDSVPERLSFPATEEAILKYWKDIDAFQTSLKKSEGRPLYSFYDGPPFATGLPHYGHILAGTIKDTVTRYAHQTGHHVPRRFGWDCHGLPIEFEIDKDLGVKTRDDVLKMGIPAYNAACRKIVMRYAGEWENVVTRLGRWIDFKNDYKTLDTSFMESVWWVFKQIHEKGFLYKGFKVMPYSTACTTPLSNFEANLAYKDVQDPAVTVSFPLLEDPNVSFVAWTTTPWTLPSNLALCVNPDMDYVKVQSKATKAIYIMLEKRTVQLFKDASEFDVLARYKGKELAGKEYKPMFDYFLKEKAKGAFRILSDAYVTEESGTGVVHCAPAFGEDDYRVCAEAGIVVKGAGIVCPVDDNGRFTSEVSDFAGRHVKESDKEIIKKIKDMGRVVHAATITHSYPFCWRSDTPLIYKAVPSWFIRVENVVDKLLANNKQSYWVPDYVQEKRFHNWLADAKDWAISRNRYWGTPIPIWLSEDGEEMVVVGSVAELEELSGVKGITDLHRENIDHITIPSKKGKGVLKRIDEVFDCWFESGSMPYAQQHYPFENKDVFEKGFPADFIAEGIDQTRGWFYTLLVISTILYEKPPFKNLIVNGLVLASDGRKMSKRLRNYPDPMAIVNDYGADALRLYLINSPVVRAESLKFQEKGVRDIIKDVFLPWFNAYRFFVEAVRKYNKSAATPFKPDIKLALGSTNIMDKWILAATNSLIEFVRKEMAAYRLYTVVPQLVKFIDQLTNWYVRLNRKRMKGSNGEKDCNTALATLFEVIFTITKAMAPFTPFLTEYFYQNLKKVIPAAEAEDSVHYLMFPEPVPEAMNKRIEEAVSRMQAVIQLGRQARDRKNLPLKFPLSSVTVFHKDEQYRQDITDLKSYILEELNLKEVLTSSDDSEIVPVARPDFKALGTRLKGDIQKVKKAITELTKEQIKELEQNGTIVLMGHTITSQELQITKTYKGDSSRYEPAWDSDVLILLDIRQDESMKEEGLAREVINRIQKLRKKSGIHPTDPIEVFYKVDPKSALAKVMVNKKSFIQKTITVPLAPYEQKPTLSVVLGTEESNLFGTKITFFVNRLAFGFSTKNLASKCPDDSFVTDLQTFVVSRDYSNVMKELKDGKLTVNLNGKEVVLEFGKDFFRSVDELLASGQV